MGVEVQVADRPPLILGETAFRDNRMTLDSATQWFLDPDLAEPVPGGNQVAPDIIVSPSAGGVTFEIWVRDGWLHRDGDLPAYKDSDGVCMWFRHGLMHRDGDQPALVEDKSNRAWYRNGIRHRDGARPAIEGDAGEFWYHGGLPHRATGPARCYKDGSTEWWWRGNQVNEDVVRRMNRLESTHLTDEEAFSTLTALQHSFPQVAVLAVDLITQSTSPLLSDRTRTFARFLH